MIFIDLDLNRFNSKLALDLGLNGTLQNIKNKLGSGVKPTVMWSGHGYHVYQPVEAFVLEEESEFAKFEQPSRRLLQFAEYCLSDRKADPCHKITISLKNCMLRIPGSYNTKSTPYEEVRIIQQWDGFRPSIKPLLFDLICIFKTRNSRRYIKSNINNITIHLVNFVNTGKRNDSPIFIFWTPYI